MTKTRSLATAALTLGLISAGTAVASAAPAATQSDSVNAYVWGLDYDSRTVLAVDGDKVTSVQPKEGKLAEGTFTVIERNKRKLDTSGTDISVINASATAAYPGALVLADRNLLDSRPTVVQLDRSPVTVSLDLPGLAGSQNAVKVESPTRSSVNGAVNTILDRWTNGPGKGAEEPARFQYTEAEAYSQAQLAAKFGYSFKQVAGSLGLDLDAVHKGTKRTMVASFKQIFYTASVDEPNSPAAFFGKDVKAQDLRNRGVSAKTPPAYVSSVDYGRQIYVKLETNSTSTQVKAAFDAALKGHTVNLSTEIKNVLKNTSFTALVIGGSASGHVKIVTGKAEALNKALDEFSVYSPKNPGSPISYTVKYLKNNEQAVVKNATEYVETKVQTFRAGKTTLVNRGAYVARFYLTWDEVSYDKDGNRKLTPKAWRKNGSYFTAPWAATVNLPANATNIRVKAQEATGLAWDPWWTVVDEQSLPLTHNRVVTIWGTTLNPSGSITVPPLKD